MVNIVDYWKIYAFYQIFECFVFDDSFKNKVPLYLQILCEKNILSWKWIKKFTKYYITIEFSIYQIRHRFLFVNSIQSLESWIYLIYIWKSFYFQTKATKKQHKGAIIIITTNFIYVRYRIFAIGKISDVVIRPIFVRMLRSFFNRVSVDFRLFRCINTNTFSLSTHTP